MKVKETINKLKRAYYRRASLYHFQAARHQQKFDREKYREHFTKFEEYGEKIHALETEE